MNSYSNDLNENEILASSNFDKVTQELAELKGLQIRLWNYRISHSVLQFRVAHCKVGETENYFNTLIHCAGTEKIIIEKTWWESNLNITFVKKFPQTFRLSDEEAGFLIECANVSIEKFVPPKFFGFFG